MIIVIQKQLFTTGLNQELLDKFYPLTLEKDIGLKDSILESHKKLANIVIYNGCTGSFLDNITRSGKISHKLTYGVKRDLISLEATLKFIQNSNRICTTNTQVYICGVPNFLGLNISEFVNIKLRKIAREYANVTYVEPVKSKFLYKKYEQEDNKNNVTLSPDIHYDEIEYLKFNNNIIESIIADYLINNVMINLDRIFYHLSSDIELNNQYLIGQNNYIQKYIDEILNNEILKLTSEQKKKLLNRLKKYIEDKVPYDFYYIGKENFNKAIKQKK